MKKSAYKLGTRKSLLAIAQSSWVARELERLNPGIKIELVGIETRGDIVLDKPLSQIEGKEFFTAELDHALIRNEVDLTVHSMKDLSLERPPQIKLAATPKREFAHDIIIFHETVVDRLKKGLPIRVGTSSPRRLTLIPDFLKTALPRLNGAKEPILEFVQIRGNVNTRISRVHEPEGTEKKLDAVVLAFAGLERLGMDEKASIELKRLLQNTRKMILPLKQNPSAPAQGALAIEVNSASVETLAMVQKLHDPETLRNVTEERKILAEWGGGCHLKLGASVLADHSLVIRGVTPNGESVSEVRNAKSAVKEFVKIEAQELFDFIPATLSPEAELLLSHSTTLFVAHPRAYEHLTHKAPIHTDYGKRVWVSGMKSWLSLAQNGVWVEGCLEGAGFKKMKEFQSKKLLSFVGPVLFISHSEAHQDSGAMIATYTHQFREIPEKIKTETSLFWSSGLLFRTAWNKLGKDFMLSKKHASGPGKTAETLSELLTPHGVKPDVFTLES